MQSSKNQARKAKILQAKPLRDEQGSENKSFLEDLQILLRLRQYSDKLSQITNKLEAVIEDKEKFIDDQEQMINLQQISCDIDMMKMIMRQRGIQFTELRRQNRGLWVDNSLQHVFGILRLALPTAEQINGPSQALIREAQPLMNITLYQLLHFSAEQNQPQHQNTIEDTKSQ